MDRNFFQAAFAVILMAVLCGVAGSLFYYKRYYLPEKKTIARLEIELEEVKKARKIWEEAIKKGRGEANYEVRFNYFTEKGISGSEIAASWLKELTPWLIKNHITFQRLDLVPPVTINRMKKYVFGLHGLAGFGDILSTMRWIEEKKRGVITDFRVSRPYKKGKRAETGGNLKGRLDFSLSWYWIEEAPDRFHSVVKPGEPISELGRDPFRCFLPAVNVPEKTAGNRIVWRPAPAGVVLEGIIKVKDGYRAILNGSYLKTGESVDGYKVLSINRKGVVLARRNYRYRLSLKTFGIKKRR